MKKILCLGIILVCALSTLTGCGSQVEGKWRVVKAEFNGKPLDDVENYEMIFNSDGTGVFIVNFNEKKYENSFDWEQNGDEYDIKYKDENETQNKVKFENDQLIYTMKKEHLTTELITVYYLEQLNDNDNETSETNNSSESEASPQEQLKKANSNAKLISLTVGGTVADLLSDGHTIEINKGKNGPIEYTKLDESNPVEKSIKTAMSDNGITDGKVVWEIDKKNYHVLFVQWSKEDNGIVGQYPDPETNPSVNHSIGNKF